ncbi:rRNA small subunit methyltransferase I [Thioalkalivibrio nitratireducens DSM 14787]|uniref:Ribosomal RNA small subunit methyltransferase I n=1 Tax=Thioalkalivibrio nitratireducens (strain DSM 14787 / UNIQEM 213 / ALEN2) TaxID=1255043 RepID=L0DZ61_THIND|nr:16S rRNA (cytidine(1402)-2'-O)-methyltransferase [Thioalkalivibrio nitratireducens]AGA34255.1 rRNA small subunit methyltransferase I [Thioalkalivibrio nitratireducens DSM 14787]
MVATPIGNLEDLSPRARRILGEADLVVAEDTRHSGRLLAYLGLSKPLLSLHEHNEAARVPQLLERLRQGAHLALVSDAGTPLVSDPGYRLVRAVREGGLPVFPVPGPSAVMAALSVAGLPSDRFWFEGFLPASVSARRQRLEKLLTLPVTVCCFESAHRIRASAGDLADLAPEREVVLAREITKQFEQHYFGFAATLPEWLGADPNRGRGEFVLLIAGAQESAEGGEPGGGVTAEEERVLDVLLAALPLKQAVKLAVQLTGVPRNRLYSRALARQR